MLSTQSSLQLPQYFVKALTFDVFVARFLSPFSASHNNAKTLSQLGNLYFSDDFRTYRKGPKMG